MGLVPLPPQGRPGAWKQRPVQCSRGDKRAAAAGALTSTKLRALQEPGYYGGGVAGEASSLLAFISLTRRMNEALALKEQARSPRAVRLEEPA